MVKLTSTVHSKFSRYEIMTFNMKINEFINTVRIVTRTIFYLLPQSSTRF